MRIRFQPSFVVQPVSRLGHAWMRGGLALWRAALLSTFTYVALTASLYMDYSSAALSLILRPAFKFSVGLEWLPYQVGRLVQILRVPDDLAVLCGFKTLAIPVQAFTGAWTPPPPPHLVIGNYWLDLLQFRQHMLTSTLVYFVIFMAISQLRQAWLRRSQSSTAR